MSMLAIKPENVPDAAWLAMRDQMREGIRNEATLIAAALNAWPGMRHIIEGEPGRENSELILPLPQEKPDGE